MQLLKRQLTEVTFAPITTVEKTEGGLYTGELVKTYGTPITIKVDRSPATGKIIQKMFGDFQNYSLAFLVEPNDNLTEDVKIFVDTTFTVSAEPDYRIVRIAKSFNHWAVACEKL